MFDGDKEMEEKDSVASPSVLFDLFTVILLLLEVWYYWEGSSSKINVQEWSFSVGIQSYSHSTYADQSVESHSLHGPCLDPFLQPFARE